MLSDTIAALATPPGRSALAVVRVSGERAFAVAAQVIAGFQALPARTSRLALLRDGTGQPVDRGLYVAFPGPASYTGEDAVEISCHGGSLTPVRVLGALYAAGARAAAPGEFTRRAVLNGKLDLVQAEAVADLVDATAPVQARSALHQLEGGLSRRIDAIREAVLDLLAQLGYDIDFPEEDDGPIPAAQILSALDRTRQTIARLLDSAPAGERLREGALVVFAGRPNVGKSSLFNALLGTERALVTEVPGTTRDTVEAHSDIDGWPVRFADTAGLWDAPDRVDRMGVAVSRRYLAAADLILLCVEAGRPLDAEERGIAEGERTLIVRTKQDLVGAAQDGGIQVSALTGFGIGDLRGALVGRLFAAGSGGVAADPEPALTRERHRLALERAATELAAARARLDPDGDAVLAAHHVQAAAGALDELIGVVNVEEVLDRIFSRFCVGK